MAMSQEMESVFLTVRAYINLSDVLHVLGRTREAYELLRDGCEDLARRGHNGTWIQLQQAEMTYHLGMWAKSAALMPPEMAPRHRGMTLVFYEIRRAELELARGDHETARSRLLRARELASRSFEPQWHVAISALLGALERRERRLEAARDVIEEALARLEGEQGTLISHPIARLLSAGAGIEADAAQQARDLGRPDDEARAIEAARDYASRAAALADRPSASVAPETRAHELVAAAEAARAAGTPDPELWAAAAEAYRAIDRPYRVARNRWREAEARLAIGDRAGAEEAAREAYMLARRLGAAWVETELEGLARRARMRLDPLHPVRDQSDAADDPAAALGLTPREREVLVLVAQGRTNREIGDLLYMAEKTASVHVSRILAKLDVRSRTEAAAVAHRLGVEISGEPAVA